MTAKFQLAVRFFVCGFCYVFEVSNVLMKSHRDHVATLLDPVQMLQQSLLALPAAPAVSGLRCGADSFWLGPESTLAPRGGDQECGVRRLSVTLNGQGREEGSSKQFDTLGVYSLREEI